VAKQLFMVTSDEASYHIRITRHWCWDMY